MTPRPPVPPLHPPGDLFGSGPRAATARAAVEGAGDVSPTRTSPAVPAPAPGPDPAALHMQREAWALLRGHGPYARATVAPGWTLWLPADPAAPRLGIADSLMAALLAAGHAALDEGGTVSAIRKEHA